MKYGKNSVIVFLLSLFCLMPFVNAQCLGNDASFFLDLDHAYRLAIKNHEQIMIAQKEIDKSKLLPKKANSIMMPKVNIYGEYKEHDEDIAFEAELGDIPLPPIITVPEHQLGGNFEVVQPLYKGSWLPRKEQANQSVHRDTEDYYQVVQNILFQVAQIYYEVVKVKELVELTHEILKLVEDEKRVAQARFEAGAVTEDAVLNAELKITSSRSKLIEYGNRFTLIKNMLKRFVGEDIGPFYVLPPPKLPSDDRDFPELIGTALESRHDYKKVQAMVDIAQADVKLAKSHFHPSLESSWDYFSIDNPSYSQDNDYWVFAVQLKIPLFEGGVRIWELKEKIENIEQAELGAEDFNKSIRIEVEEAMLSVKTLESVLANLEKQEELAQKNYEIVFAKFDFGAATSVELGQALSTLESVKSDRTIKKYDYEIALLSLEKTVGLFAKDIIGTM